MRLKLNDLVLGALKELADSTRMYRHDVIEQEDDEPKRLALYRRMHEAEERVLMLTMGLFPAPRPRAPRAKRGAS